MMGTMDVMPLSTSEVEVMAKFRQDKLRREKLYFSSAYVGKNFIRLAVRERQSRNMLVSKTIRMHEEDYLRASWTRRSTSSSLLTPRAWARRAVWRWSFCHRRSSRYMRRASRTNSLLVRFSSLAVRSASRPSLGGNEIVQVFVVRIASTP